MHLKHGGDAQRHVLCSCSPPMPEQHLGSASGLGEGGEATDELAARLQRIEAAASHAEGDVDSDSDSEQVSSMQRVEVMQSLSACSSRGRSRHVPLFAVAVACKGIFPRAGVLIAAGVRILCRAVTAGQRVGGTPSSAMSAAGRAAPQTLRQARSVACRPGGPRGRLSRSGRQRRLRRVCVTSSARCTMSG